MIQCEEETCITVSTIFPILHSHPHKQPMQCAAVSGFRLREAAPRRRGASWCWPHTHIHMQPRGCQVKTWSIFTHTSVYAHVYKRDDERYGTSRWIMWIKTTSWGGGLKPKYRRLTSKTNVTSMRSNLCPCLQQRQRRVMDIWQLEKEVSVFLSFVGLRLHCRSSSGGGGSRASGHGTRCLRTIHVNKHNIHTELG